MQAIVYWTNAEIVKLGSGMQRLVDCVQMPSSNRETSCGRGVEVVKKHEMELRRKANKSCSGGHRLRRKGGSIFGAG